MVVNLQLSEYIVPSFHHISGCRVKFNIRGMSKFCHPQTDFIFHLR